MLVREPALHRASDKYQSLLWAAIVAFSRRGVRGMSLRDVAAEAGTSLTLIDHHFGSKNELLNSAIASLLSTSRAALSTLSFTLETTTELSTEKFVEAWLRYVETAFAHGTGLTYLRLMRRLQTDDALDATTRDGLDASHRPIRRALRRLHPTATARSLDAAWSAASGAIYAHLAGIDSAQDILVWQEELPVLTDFVTSGLKSTLRMRSPSSSETAGDAGT